MEENGKMEMGVLCIMIQVTEECFGMRNESGILA